MKGGIERSQNPSLISTRTDFKGRPQHETRAALASPAPWFNCLPPRPYKLAASANLAHITSMNLFRCPKCATEYTVTRIVQMPVWKPICMVCGHLFMPIQNGYWL